MSTPSRVFGGVLESLLDMLCSFSRMLACSCSRDYAVVPLYSVVLQGGQIIYSTRETPGPCGVAHRATDGIFGASERRCINPFMIVVAELSNGDISEL